jgi:4-hydroxybenzoate polyprenyltransferase
MMRRLALFAGAVKVEHTVFALPFAYISMILAAGGWPGWHVLVWVTLALLGARTAAMSLNRLIDRAIDARNPRTARRHLPAGLLSTRDVAIGTIAGVALMFVSAWQLNPLCLMLAPLALVFLVGYPYTKRFTIASHWILGFTDGIAAAGGWIAVTGHFAPPAFILWFAVTFWIAGFDLIYACQDIDFDRREGLHSVPARFGTAVALRLAQFCHLLTVLALAALPLFVPLSWPYWVGLAIVAGLFIYEHSLVSPTDLSRAGVAFFNVNGYISLIMLVSTVAGRWLLSS